MKWFNQYRGTLQQLYFDIYASPVVISSPQMKIQNYAEARERN